MKNFHISITLVGALILIFINTWVTIALGFVLAGMRLMVGLILRNHIKPDHMELFDTENIAYVILSKFVLWDSLQFDQTKTLITAIKKGNYFDVVVALYAGADADLGMMANIASSASNQEAIKIVLIHFGAELIEGEDKEALFVDELDLDNYYPIRDLSMNFLEATGVVDEGYRPVKLDQIKGVLLAVERFGVRKNENIETTLSQSRADVKTEEEIDNEIRTYLSRFSVHDTIRDEKLTFYSKAQRVPCINPLCQYGKVTCPTCNGSKTLICDRCDGSGVLDSNAEIPAPVTESIQCKACNGKGTMPGNVTEVECECREEPATFIPKVDCKVCGGKGIIKEDYCHNCEGSGKVCALCGGSGIREIVEDGPVCIVCGGAGVIESLNAKVNDGPTTCGQCEGTGSVICNTCLEAGKLDCDRCEGQGHMFRNVKMNIELDAFPAGDHTSYIQFDQEEMNRLFISDHASIINSMRTIEDVKVYRHEDRMVGKLFHNPTNPLLSGVNSFLGEIDAPYNQAYERVELIVATYHFVSLKWDDGTNKRILFINEKECLAR
jgi:hypothetical protein